MKTEKLYYYFSIIFIICVIVSNVIGGRLISVGEIQLPASILVFPITFIIGDLLSELFGFKKTLQVILLGFAANFFAVGIFYIASILPAPAGWELSRAYSSVFIFAPRILIGSFTAFLIGGTLNSWIMVLMKKATKEKLLWLRTSVSTIAGEFLDSLIFCTIAFIGSISMRDIMFMILLQASLKVAYELVFTPVIYLVKNRVERERKESGKNK